MTPELSKILTSARYPVFFGGAGVSTESGIPDFRSIDGLYYQRWDYPPETILSNTFFWNHTEDFYHFYLEKILRPLLGSSAAQPNPAHIYLANHQIPIITQNIDGLHQAAGSKQVAELHGSVLRNCCTNCNHFYDLGQLVELLNSDSNHLPHCTQRNCYGIIKPDMVLYEEPLNQKVWNQAIEWINASDLLIVGGTSLIVYPAASLINIYLDSNISKKNTNPSKKIVMINLTSTPQDNFADLIIHQPIGEVFLDV